jgi:hypothetical protein
VKRLRWCKEAACRKIAARVYREWVLEEWYDEVGEPALECKIYETVCGDLNDLSPEESLPLEAFGEAVVECLIAQGKVEPVDVEGCVARNLRRRGAVHVVCALCGARKLAVSVRCSCEVVRARAVPVTEPEHKANDVNRKADARRRRETQKEAERRDKQETALKKFRMLEGDVRSDVSNHAAALHELRLRRLEVSEIAEHMRLAADEVKFDLQDNLQEARRGVGLAEKLVADVESVMSRRREQLSAAEEEARRLSVLPPETGPLAKSFASAGAAAESARTVSPRSASGHGPRERPSPAKDQVPSPVQKRSKNASEEDVVREISALPALPALPTATSLRDDLMVMEEPLLREATTPERRSMATSLRDDLSARGEDCEELVLDTLPAVQSGGDGGGALSESGSKKRGARVLKFTPSDTQYHQDPPKRSVSDRVSAAAVDEAAEDVVASSGVVASGSSGGVDPPPRWTEFTLEVDVSEHRCKAREWSGKQCKKNVASGRLCKVHVKQLQIRAVGNGEVECPSLGYVDGDIPNDKYQGLLRKRKPKPHENAGPGLRSRLACAGFMPVGVAVGAVEQAVPAEVHEDELVAEPDSGERVSAAMARAVAKGGGAGQSRRRMKVSDFFEVEADADDCGNSDESSEDGQTALEMTDGDGSGEQSDEEALHRRVDMLREESASGSQHGAFALGDIGPARRSGWTALPSTRAAGFSDMSHIRSENEYVDVEMMRRRFQRVGLQWSGGFVLPGDPEDDRLLEAFLRRQFREMQGRPGERN